MSERKPERRKEKVEVNLLAKREEKRSRFGCVIPFTANAFVLIAFALWWDLAQ